MPGFGGGQCRSKCHRAQYSVCAPEVTGRRWWGWLAARQTVQVMAHWAAQLQPQTIEDS
jgi:hypothetical protein